MHKLLILTKNQTREKYREHLAAAKLPNLEIVNQASPDVDIVLGDPDLVRDSLPELPGLKWAQATWAGVEPLLDPLLNRSYTLTNARGVFGMLMSEYVFGYLLLHERKILQRLEAQKQSQWDASLPGSLRGKTIGLLGVGSIGAHLAQTAKHFGMRVHGFTRSSESSSFVDNYFHGMDLVKFASGLDILVSALPNTVKTHKIISTELFSALPKSTIFINVGRGSALDDDALIDALNRDKLALAVLDVFDQEPLPPQHPFWHTKNLIITSHTAAPSFPADISGVFIENYNLFQNDKPLKYKVNFELGY